jgi:hypothetical protein
MTGDVNPAPTKPEGVEAVVKEKLIYYCSSFDLNVNEWFTEYENTEIFKRRMKLKLGMTFSIHYLYRSKLGQILLSSNRNHSLFGVRV